MPTGRGRARTHLDRVSAQPVDHVEAVFIGLIVTDKYRRPACKRRLLQELEDGEPLVLSRRLHFHDALAELQAVLAAELREDRTHRPLHEVGELWNTPVMQRQ